MKTSSERPCLLEREIRCHDPAKEVLPGGPTCKTIVPLRVFRDVRRQPVCLDVFLPLCPGPLWQVQRLSESPSLFKAPVRGLRLPQPISQVCVFGVNVLGPPWDVGRPLIGPCPRRPLVLVLQAEVPDESPRLREREVVGVLLLLGLTLVRDFFLLVVHGQPAFILIREPAGRRMSSVAASSGPEGTRFGGECL